MSLPLVHFTRDSSIIMQCKKTFTQPKKDKRPHYFFKRTRKIKNCLSDTEDLETTITDTALLRHTI